MVSVQAGDLVISEFMASTSGPLADEDDDFSDWIEVHNTTLATVSVAGWYLTDDATDLIKWRFPAVEIAADGYLLVFASGKNRAVTGSELHTNFRLNQAGEYLALTRPDGVTVEHDFGPGYPNQRSDYSYGVTSADEIKSEFIKAGDAVRYHVPADNTLGDSWRASAFNDATWTSGSNRIGFSAGFPLEIYLPFNETSGLSVADASGNDRVGTISGTQWVNDAERGRVAEFSSTDFISAPLTRLPGSFTIVLWAYQTTRSNNSLGLFQIQKGGNFPNTSSKVIGGWVSSTSTPPGSIWGRVIQSNGAAMNLGNTGTILPLDTWTHVVYRADGTKYEVFLNGVQTGKSVAFDGTLSDHDMLFVGKQGTESFQGRIDDFAVWSAALSNAQIAALAAGASPADYSGFAQVIDTDVSPIMQGQSSSLYLRSAFEVPSLVTFDRLALQMRYDDGFAAFLNGAMVAWANVPASLDWNSVATTEQSNSAAVAYQTFDLTLYQSLLTTGTNVLAIQGLNLTDSDTDLLITPEVSGSQFLPPAIQFMETPTPGSANEPGIMGFVADTKFSADRGLYEQPIALAITCSTPDAEIYYTTDGSIPAPENSNASVYATTLTISGTTMLRAAAFKSGFKPSNVDTHTYIFPTQVLHQDPLNDPNAPTYPTVWQAGATADYEMDPRIATDTSNPLYQPSLKDDLYSLPSISIVMDHKDLWSGSTAIYPDATKTGEAYRKPSSVEYILPFDERDFQVNCGVQMHGNASRDNARLKKHSFRLIFKDEYDGPSNLKYPMFADSGLEEFNTLVLRACFTDAFPTRTVAGRYSPHDSQYLRDAWTRNTQLDMGHLSSHSSFAHLYINGLYWGLYNIAERIDDAFIAGYEGRDREEYDIFRDAGGAYRGTSTIWDEMFAITNAGLASNAAYQAIQGNNPDGTRNMAMTKYLDVVNLIDFMLLHIFFGAEDWPSHNWYAIRRTGTDSDGFRFYVWDQEIGLDNLDRNKIDVADDRTPARLYSKLRENAEFRMLFADRIQKHMFNDGALTIEANRARWMRLANWVERAIVGESARWGDPREIEIGKVMTIDDWLAERDEIINNYLPAIDTITIQRFQSGNLFPTLDAPVFAQHGGNVPVGYVLSIANPDGVGNIYYTLDGSDPRQPGGAIDVDSARHYTGPFTLTDTAIVRARVLNGSVWSALVEATFSLETGASALRVTELMYNPLPAPVGSLFNNDDYEFIELQNTGAGTLDLSGVSFSDGIDYTFPTPHLLAPGTFVVLVRNETAFAERYGTTIRPVGEYSGSLDNNGERVEIEARDGSQILRFEYGDGRGWPLAADGGGHSLVPLTSAIPTENDISLDYGRNWRVSAFINGSPGRTNPAQPLSLRINEVAAHTDFSSGTITSNDWIEILNPTGAAVALGAEWYLSDDINQPRKWALPEVWINAGEHLVFDEITHFHAPEGFGLSKAGEQVILSYLPGTTGDRIVDAVRFKGMENGSTLGRYPDGGAFFKTLAPTRETANSLPMSDIVISELFYNSPGPEMLEFLELLNPTSQTILLANEAGEWRLDGDVSYTFPPATTLASGERLLLVSFHPDDTSLMEFFSSTLGGMPPDARVYGPYAPMLSNRVGRIALERPQLADPPSTAASWVIVDEVCYFSRAPFDPQADGAGYSLQRIDNTLAGNDPANWRIALPSPDAEPSPAWPVNITSAHGAVSFSAFGPIYAEGSTLTLTVNPDPGFRFLTWAGMIPLGEETSNPLTITIHGPVSLEVLYFRQPPPVMWIVK